MNICADILAESNQHSSGISPEGPWNKAPIDISPYRPMQMLCKWSEQLAYGGYTCEWREGGVQGHCQAREKDKNSR